MKTNIINKKKNQQSIDWDRIQLVRLKSNGDIVLTTGKHSNTDFSGVKIYSQDYGIEYRKIWDKLMFEPVTENITIEFESIY